MDEASDITHSEVSLRLSYVCNKTMLLIWSIRAGCISSRDMPRLNGNSVINADQVGPFG
jgi:hypothetical protein